jgi:hypothetical protein
MAALAQLTRHNRDNQDAVARMGGIKPIVQLLESSSTDVTSYAASALMEISRGNLPNQKTVVDLGAVGQLGNLIKTSNDERVKAEVAGAIWSLSETPEIKAMFGFCNAPLVTLLGMGSVRAREHAAGALASLGLDNKANQVVLTQLLVELLINGNREAQERAVKALNALVKENTSAHEVIAQAGNPKDSTYSSQHRTASRFSFLSMVLRVTIRFLMKNRKYPRAHTKRKIYTHTHTHTGKFGRRRCTLTRRRGTRSSSRDGS